MERATRVLALIGLLAAVMTNAPASATDQVSLTAADGGLVAGRYQAADDPGAPLILLFHQAGSSKDEYAPIQPRLAAAGYASLAIDQRSGGSYLGGRNETLAARGGADATYDDAYPDLEAALAWANKAQPGRPVILCGSSYSAALVFLLAAAHPGQIAAVLAFSPGEYLGTTGAVVAAAAKVHVPVFVTSAPTAGEQAAAGEILTAVPAGLKIQFRPTNGGVHGASTLREDSNPQGASAIWQAVLAFLHQAVPSAT